MGEAILSRLLSLGLYEPEQVIVSDPSPERQTLLSSQYKVLVTEDNRKAATGTVLLAVKPQGFAKVAAGLTGTPISLLLSILAGTTLTQLESAFPNLPVIRAMPNTPAQVGAGVTALAAGQWVSAGHLSIARQVFGSVGEVLEVPEPLMNAVTGLSGSGPGYVALIVEALTDGGVAAGLPRATAAQLALQTLLGSAELLKKTGMHPAELKDRVTSPGGTTIAGIASLEQAGLRSALIEAVLSATKRAQELGAK
ncbi:pyrroline-5-carboxylate reductase [Leptolyngbya sp. FACHB-261]|nr:pyrroline-5-carboxylate reductase [Leptolyngbya sp. FACHB-261]